MTGNGNQNGVGNVQHDSAIPRDPEASVALLTRSMGEFISEMNGVVTPDSVSGRARFPGFAVQQVIREKITAVVEELDKKNIQGAWMAFNGVRRHFNNQQAAFARGRLLNELTDELNSAVEAECDEDLVVRVRRDVEAYSNLVTPDSGGDKDKYFDLSDASRLCWVAIDTIASVKEEFHTRQRVRKAQEADRVLQTACSKGADGLRALITKQSAVW